MLDDGAVDGELVGWLRARRRRLGDQGFEDRVLHTLLGGSERGGDGKGGTHDDGGVPQLGLGVLVELRAFEGAGAGLATWVVSSLALRGCGCGAGGRGGIRTSLAICSRRFVVMGCAV